MVENKINNMKKTLMNVDECEELEEYLWWCCNKSKLKIIDFQNKVISYPKYKPGEIIYVTAGVNIGSEVKGGHYALVLKTSTKRSRTVNIVYPTSKEKNKSQYELNNTILDYVYHKFQLVDEEIEKKEHEMKDSLNDFEARYDSVFGLSNEEVTLEQLTNLRDELSIQKEKNMKIHDERKNSIEHLGLLAEKGDTISKKSYVNINQLAVISKNRINYKKTNYFGKLR